MLVGIFLADRIGVGGNDAVHGDVGALIVAALFKQQLRLALHAQTARQRTLRRKPPPNGILHGFPHGFQIIPQSVVLHVADELREAHAALPAQQQNLREMLLGIQLDLLLGAFPLNADGAAADAENAV